MSGIRFLTFSLVAASCVAGCSESAKDHPTWREDVRPILLANCVRCHGEPAIGGAPSSFRLDVYETTSTPDGHVLFGAKTMAQFAAQRASDGTMPPRFPLTDVQKATLENWAEDQKAELAEPSDSENQAPVADATSSETENGLEMELLISDPDHDYVTGQVAVKSGSSIVETVSLVRSGRNALSLDFRRYAPGAYVVVATLEDGVAATEVEVAEFTRESGDVAPRISVFSPGSDVLVTDLDVAAKVFVSVDDPDSAEITVSVDAVRGDERIEIAAPAQMAPGQVSLTWPHDKVPAGNNWRLVAKVSDGKLEGSATSFAFAVGHGTTSLRWTDVEPLFGKACTICHPGLGIPDVPHVFSSYDGVTSLRGLVYQRAVAERTMPPISAEGLFSSFSPLSPSEVDTLGEWLLAGAPQ